MAWALLRDARSPWAARLAVLAAAVYLVSPVDFISDLLPLLGWVDDGVVVLLLLKLATRLLPADLAAALRAKVARRQPAAR